MWLNKLQNLPEKTKKIILWSVVIIIGLSLATWWAKNLQKRIKSFEKEEFIEELKLPFFGEELKGLPKINEEEFKKLEEIIKKAEKQIPEE